MQNYIYMGRFYQCKSNYMFTQHSCSVRLIEGPVASGRCYQFFRWRDIPRTQVSLKIIEFMSRQRSTYREASHRRVSHFIRKRDDVGSLGSAQRAWNAFRVFGNASA